MEVQELYKYLGMFWKNYIHHYTINIPWKCSEERTSTKDTEGRLSGRVSESLKSHLSLNVPQPTAGPGIEGIPLCRTSPPLPDNPIPCSC